MLPPALTRTEIDELTPDQLVNKLWDKRVRLHVERRLVGGLNRNEIRDVRLTPEVEDAVIRGLSHPSPVVRRFCLTLIDHHGGVRSIEAAAGLLNDPVPRVRKFAMHALECEECNPDPEVVDARRRLLEFGS